MSDTAKKPLQFEVLEAGEPAKQLPATASPADAMIQMAIQQQMPVESIKELVLLRNQELQRLAKLEFVNALKEAQSEMGRIPADKINKQTSSDYASYAALDRVVRPIYTTHGFSLSFDTGDCPTQDHVRVLCDVHHSGGFTKQYKIDIPADGKGARGGDVMTKTHATVSATSYGQRCLLKLIFNLAIGIDKDDDDGNAAGRTAAPKISEQQYTELHAVLTDAGHDNPNRQLALLARAMVGSENPRDIPAVRFTEAKDKLKEGLKARAARPQK